jgi:hypothetical protein
MIDVRGWTLAVIVGFLFAVALGPMGALAEALRLGWNCVSSMSWRYWTRDRWQNKRT